MIGPRWKCVVLTAVISVTPLDSIRAQEPGTATLEEIIVVGTRRSGRTASNTPVPIDVFSTEDLQSVSSADMLDVMQTLVPSFQVPRYAIADGATFVRPPQMRGMSGDKILVLVNNKRRHRSALVITEGNGSNGPDLATIPGIAVRSVEVLRDGASAMYGSDAIAGVFNFNLKDGAENGELQLQAGQYMDGNENSYTIGLNQGFALGENGFVNISAELTDSEATSRGTYFGLPIGRSGLSPSESALVQGFYDHDNNPLTPDQERFGPDAMTEEYDPVTGALVTQYVGSDGIPDDTDPRYANNLPSAEISDSPFVTVWGAPEFESIRTFINAGFEVSDSAEIYGWANYSDSDSNGSFFYRRPGDAPLVPLRTPAGEIHDPRSIYPAAFTPRFAGAVIDAGVTGGFRGETANGLYYDFGARWGESRLLYTLSNTLNPSLGPATPTSFRPGGLVADETAITADFTKSMDAGLFSDLNIAFGAEYRDEGYELLPGDPKSWEVGPYSVRDPFNFEIDADEAAAGQNGGSVGCFIPGPQYDPANLCHPNDPIHNVGSAGSNGFTGWSPDSVSTYGRDSWAGYVELEADLTDSLLATLGGRYEEFSDYGSNFSWRLAALWRITDSVRLRWSAGTGFRAPTPGQISTINLRTNIGRRSGNPETRALFPAENPAAQLYGAVPLDEETSTQFTLGITAEPWDNTTITLDYYFIALDNQVWRSSDFVVSDAERSLFQALGLPGADTLTFVSFFANDIDTESSGIELVATHAIEWGGGMTTLSLAANINETEVTSRTNRQTDPNDPNPIYFVNDNDVFAIENSSPEYRLVFSASHHWNGGWSASLRGNAYGDYQLVDSFLGDTADLGGKTFWDAEIGWQVSDLVHLTLGGSNILDEYPDPPPPFPFSSCCGQQYDTSTVMSWQGAFWYLRANFRWN